MSDESRENLGRIGFYGCTGRLVAVGRAKKPGKPPIQSTVDCPACGKSHVVSFMWRERLAEDRTPEVSL